MTRWSAGPPMEVRFAVVTVIGRDQSGVPGRDEKLVEVGRVPVARPDRGDLLVTVVVDVVGAAGAVRAGLNRWASWPPWEALGPGGLEPGEDRLAQVGLGAEVGGNFPGGEPVEPDHLAGGGDDLRARRVAASGRGDKDVPVGVAGVAGQHGERRRRSAGGSHGAGEGAPPPAGGRGDGEANNSGDKEQQSPAPRPATGRSHSPRSTNPEVGACPRLAVLGRTRHVRLAGWVRRCGATAERRRTSMANVGVVIPSPLPPGMALPEIARLARHAEMAGLDCIWAEDILARGDAAVLDIMCVLAATAAATRRSKSAPPFSYPRSQPSLGAQAGRHRAARRRRSASTGRGARVRWRRGVRYGRPHPLGPAPTDRRVPPRPVGHTSSSDRGAGCA